MLTQSLEQRADLYPRRLVGAARPAQPDQVLSIKLIRSQRSTDERETPGLISRESSRQTASDTFKHEITKMRPLLADNSPSVPRLPPFPVNG